MSSPPHPEGEVIAPSSYSATPNPADENGQPRVRGRGRNVLAAPATYILVGINCAVFLWMIVHGVSPKEPTTLQLVTVPLFILVLGGLWLLGRNGRALPVFDQLAFLAMAVIAFQAIRNIAWFALVALAVLPPLIDRLRAPVDEPRRLNRILALSLLALTGVALGGVAAEPTSWFTHAFPANAAQAAARAAGSHGLVFATSGYADWLLWSEPQLAGRVAFDSRYELLTQSQVDAIARIENAAGDWRAALRRYRVFVLGPSSDATLEHALRQAMALHVAFRSPQVVVLRRA